MEHPFENPVPNTFELLLFLDDLDINTFPVPKGYIIVERYNPYAASPRTFAFIGLVAGQDIERIKFRGRHVNNKNAESGFPIRNAQGEWVVQSQAPENSYKELWYRSRDSARTIAKLLTENGRYIVYLDVIDPEFPVFARVNGRGEMERYSSVNNDWIPLGILEGKSFLKEERFEYLPPSPYETKKWPTHVQGPYALTVTEEIPMGSYNTRICIFGEYHNTTQCTDSVMDVSRNKAAAGEYTLITAGDDARKWTIGRMFYVLAQATRTKIEYFFEIRFKGEDLIDTSAVVNLKNLIILFQECLSSSKNNCPFLSKVLMHSIDYRSALGNYFLNAQPKPLNRFARALFTLNFSLAQNDFSREIFETFVSHYYLRNHDLGYTFTPMFIWDELSVNNDYHIFSELGQEVNGRALALCVEFLEKLHGSKFHVLDTLMIYLDFQSDRYFRYIQRGLAIATNYQLQFETLLSSSVFKRTKVFLFLLNLTMRISQYVITCKRILQGNHHSVKRNAKGIIISRASFQLFKVAEVRIRQRPLINLFSEWLSLLAAHGTFTSGLFWKDLFLSSRGPDDNHAFLNQMLEDLAYFMDVPAIARIFLHRTPLKLCYVGDSHRQRMRSFFEYCRVNTKTSVAKLYECLELSEEVREIFAKMTE